MPSLSPAKVQTTFGFATLTSGLYRYAFAEGGEKGLWFGVCLATIAWVAAWASRGSNQGLGKRRWARGLGWLAIATVGGWFSYESFVKESLTQTHPRHWIMVLVSLAAAAAFWRAQDPADRDTT